MCNPRKFVLWTISKAAPSISSELWLRRFLLKTKTISVVFLTFRAGWFALHLSIRHSTSFLYASSSLSWIRPTNCCVVLVIYDMISSGFGTAVRGHRVKRRGLSMQPCGEPVLSVTVLEVSFHMCRLGSAGQEVQCPVAQGLFPCLYILLTRCWGMIMFNTGTEVSRTKVPTLLS